MQSYDYIDHIRSFNEQWTDKDQPSKTHLGDLDVNSSDVECDSNFNSVASNPDPFDHLVNSGLQDPRTYEYDPDRYGPDSYKLLEGKCSQLSCTQCSKSNVIIY